MVALLTIIMVQLVACSQPKPQQGQTGSPVTSPLPAVEIPEEVQIPDLVGLKTQQAEGAAENAGLLVITTEKPSRERPGTVLRQNPVPGTSAPEGSSVELLVAEPFPRVPAVVGDRQERAVRTLEDAGFQVRVRREISDKPARTVIAQDPAAHAVTRPGKQVTVVVAKEAPVDGGDNCSDGYSPCLPPASDYDCAGGSGDGPAYTGTVTVTGSDPYGLDADGDGVGCD